MEIPYFEFDLTKDSSLTDELNNLYDFCQNTNRYTKLILRGHEPLGFVNHTKEFENFEELNEEYYDLCENWILKKPEQVYGQFSLFGESIIWKEYPKILNYIIKQILNLYGEDIIIEKLNENKYKCKKILLSDGLLTMYKKMGQLMPHKDGISDQLKRDRLVKPANMLLYLNKDYKKEWGGCFKVDGIEIVPEFGKLVFLNFFRGNDPMHEVTLLKEDVNRIALLFNVMYSEYQTETCFIE